VFWFLCRMRATRAAKDGHSVLNRIEKYTWILVVITHQVGYRSYNSNMCLWRFAQCLGHNYDCQEQTDVQWSFFFFCLVSFIIYTGGQNVAIRLECSSRWYMVLIRPSSSWSEATSLAASPTQQYLRGLWCNCVKVPSSCSNVQKPAKPQ
jgi:hypothetical protein